MDTVRVDICYRPLRIAWAIESGDREGFRNAVRLSHTMCGGRFNPIVMVDRPEAADLIEAFRADMIVPVGAGELVKQFVERHPHLKAPFFGDGLFMPERDRPTRAGILDVHNCLVHWRHSAEWKALTEQGLRTFSWEDDDPLADVFLIYLGAYPEKDAIGIDYGQIVFELALPSPMFDIRLDQAAPLPFETIRNPSIAFLSRHSLERHYSVKPGWDYPGFYVGDCGSLDDLVTFWNLRAADISLQFIDPNQTSRYALVRPECEKQLAEMLSRRDDHRRKIAVWAARDRLDEALKLFPNGGVIGCGIDAWLWKGNMCAPMMILGEESSLGVFSDGAGRPTVSFAFKDKPFCGDVWFHTQHLVASLSFIGASPRGMQHTFRLPYIPELNAFFGQSTVVRYDSFRSEPERMGLVIDAADHDAHVAAMPTSELAERIFDMAGVIAEPSNAGLIARQLISRLGGVDGARAFKIPGVRRLIRTHGPNAYFTKSAALQLIGGKDPKNPDARFEDHEELYIEARTIGTKLTPDMVFSHLVERGIFRIGAALVCPSCRLTSWIALDQLRQRHVCELCGGEFDASRQLVEGEFRYRRSGVLGLERNAQGAIPVSLTLQQLSVNVDAFHHDGMYLPSFELTPKAGTGLPKCETDILVVLPRDLRRKTQIIIGECKDEGGRIDLNDVENMIRIADAFPRHRFEVFILFARLSRFTPREIALARRCNGEHQQRVILLTNRELEPFHLFERVEKELGRTVHGNSLEEAAMVTNEMYFRLFDARMGLLRQIRQFTERRNMCREEA